MKVFALGLVVVLASTCHAQTKSAASAPSSKEALSELQRNMPSEKEFSELLAKADEKVSEFEAAVKNAKPQPGQNRHKICNELLRRGINGTRINFADA